MKQASDLEPEPGPSDAKGLDHERDHGKDKLTYEVKTFPLIEVTMPFVLKLNMIRMLPVENSRN